MKNELEPNLEFDKVTKIVTNKSIYKMESKERVKLSKAKIVELMDKGFTKEEIHQDLYPTLNDSQWKKALIQMNLGGVKVKKIDFIIEDFETVTPNEKNYAPQKEQPKEENTGLSI